MSDYPHTYPPNAWPVNVCRCGHVRTNGAPDDCPAAMRDEIAALRAQAEALKDGAASLHKAYARGRDAGVRAGLAAAVRACTLVEVAHREKGGLYTSAVGDRDCALAIAEIDPDEVGDV